MNYRKLLLDFRLRRKDTLCCARIEIVPSIASYVANATCFLSDILPGCSSRRATELCGEYSLSRQVSRAISFETDRCQYSGVESCALE